jgi:molecular chaperone DnaK
MIKQAESHSAEDKRRKDVAEAKNEAESLLFSAEKSIEENEAKSRLRT